MNYFVEPPEYSPCWLCGVKYLGYHVKETEIQYSCPAHGELYVDWFCIRATYQQWLFDRLYITLPNHFRLHWSFRNSNFINYFLLYEWTKFKTSPGHYWRVIVDLDRTAGIFQPVRFNPEFILTKTTKQLMSFFQLYKIFS